VVAGRLVDGNDQTMGFNAQTERYENLVESGVIDPTKVVRSALQDAASIARLLITTEAAVAGLPDPNSRCWPGEKPKRRSPLHRV
jgi:chaperonin GroEL